jgi:signal transduction histidine kinase
MFFEDDNGVLWIAGDAGLARFANHQFATLKRNEHLPAASVAAIVQDTRHQLWLGTTTGISRMNATDFGAALNQRGDSLSATSLNAADGIAGTNGWVGQPSGARSFDGKLWFLTLVGMAAIDPGAIGDALPAKSLRVDVVSLDDRRTPPVGGLRVPPDVARLQIEFTVPTLSPGQQSRFRYRLDGFDTHWISAGRVRTATYTNLAPRDYGFRVQAQDAEGRWHDAPEAWTFSVEPAFYQTAWFTVLCLVASAAIAWLAWRYRVAQVRRQLAIVHDERARLSRELHDTLLQSLVGVALQCDVLANLPTPDDVTTGLGQLRRRVEGYVRECRDRLWSLRSSVLAEKGLPSALRELGGRLAGSADIQFALEVEGRAPGLSSCVDEELLRIGQEAIANAVRHAKAGSIRATLAYTSHSVRLTVEDDGQGFNPEDPLHTARGHWGLIGMEERARGVGGTLVIHSQPGLGTRVAVTVGTPDDSSDTTTAHQSSLHRRSSDRPGRHRTDHRPTA